MNISTKTFWEIAIEYNSDTFEILWMDKSATSIIEVSNLHGYEYKHSKLPFPLYDLKTDTWKWPKYCDSIQENNWPEYEMQFNANHSGLFQFDIDWDDYPEYIFYSPQELIQFLENLRGISPEQLNKKIRWRKFKLDDIIKDIHIVVEIEENNYKLDIKRFKKIVGESICKDLLNKIFDQKTYASLIFTDYNDEIISSIKEEGSKISLKDIPIIISDKVYTNCSFYQPYLFPVYITIDITKSFSYQYVLDMLNHSSEGNEILNSISENILLENNLNTLSVNVPSTIEEQIKYSSALRLQFYEYEKFMNKKHHIDESIKDIKDVFANRISAISEYILNKKTASELNALKHPLPYNIEKSFRSYIRSSEDFERYNYAGKLYNLLIRCMVLYPLEELLSFKNFSSTQEIQNIKDEIESGKPISDGTWVKLFKDIAKLVAKSENIQLLYFAELLVNIEKSYNEFYSIIPKRNDAAHFRESISVFMKTLDQFLPKAIDIFRKSFKDIQFLLIQGQNFQEDGLYIKAKRIMGYESDLETIEFKTNLPGNQFITNQLIAYKDDNTPTLVLNHYFNLKTEQTEKILLGVLDSVIDGEFRYDY